MLSDEVYLGLGANLGDPLEQVRRAAEALIERTVLEPPIRKSSLYRTPPWGPVADQPWFVNAVIAGRAALAPDGLLAEIKQIERDLGRADDAPRWGPRAIDIDILLYGQVVLDTPSLSIPHPQMPHRAFVLIPLLELAPALLDPRTGRPFRADLDRVGPEAERIEKMDESL